MEIANIHEAKSQLSKLVEHCHERRRGSSSPRPDSRWYGWSPSHADRSPRQGGQWKGRVPHRRRFRRLCPTTSPLAFGIEQPMTLSLDTHVFLWWLDDPQLLSKAACKAIADGRNTVYVSAAVAWEIAIKKALGKTRRTG